MLLVVVVILRGDNKRDMLFAQNSVLPKGVFTVTFTEISVHPRINFIVGDTEILMNLYKHCIILESLMKPQVSYSG